MREAYEHESRESLRSIGQAIWDNVGSLQLSLPRETLTSIRNARLSLAELSSETKEPVSLEEMESSLERVIAALAEFRRVVDTSNWRDTGRDLFDLGRHIESFQLLRQLFADGATRLIEDAEQVMLSDARRTACHVRSLPADEGLRASLDDAAAMLDRAVLDQDLQLANAGIDHIIALLGGTFIVGPPL
jgi:hypothetical protein